MKTSHFFFCLTLFLSALILTGCPKEKPEKQDPAQTAPAASTHEAATPATDPASVEKKEIPALPVLPSEKDLKKPSEVIEIANSKQFVKFLDENPLVVVDFNATWCGPCRFLMPKLEEWSVEYKKNGIKFLSVDVDKNSGIARAYDVGPIPDIRFIVNGKVTEKVIGSNVPKIQNELEKMASRKNSNAISPPNADAPKSKDVKPEVAKPEDVKSKDVKSVKLPEPEKTKIPEAVKSDSKDKK